MSSLKAGLGSFKKLVSDLTTLSGWATKGVVAAPLADLVLGFGPPWPSQLPILTSCFEIVVLLLVFSTWSGKGSPTMKRLIWTFGVLTGVAFMVYLVLASQLMLSAPDGTRFSAGLIVRQDVAPLVKSDYTTMDALRDAAWDPEQVWTKSSITMVRAALIAFWFATFGCFVSCLAVFVLRQQAKR
jgi:hypothetical protein